MILGIGTFARRMHRFWRLNERHGVAIAWLFAAVVIIAASVAISGVKPFGIRWLLLWRTNAVIAALLAIASSAALLRDFSTSRVSVRQISFLFMGVIMPAAAAWYLWWVIYTL